MDRMENENYGLLENGRIFCGDKKVRGVKSRVGGASGGEE
jgi:hypothetical protein